MNQFKLKEFFPELVLELEYLLRQEEEYQLAEQVPELWIVDRCRCKEYFCGMFYTVPKPDGAWGPNHRNVPLVTESGEITLDVVDEKITAVEILFRNDFREKLFQLLP